MDVPSLRRCCGKRLGILQGDRIRPLQVRRTADEIRERLCKSVQCGFGSRPRRNHFIFFKDRIGNVVEYGLVDTALYKASIPFLAPFGIGGAPCGKAAVPVSFRLSEFLLPLFKITVGFRCNKELLCRIKPQRLLCLRQLLLTERRSVCGGGSLNGGRSLSDYRIKYDERGAGIFLRFRSEFFYIAVGIHRPVQHLPTVSRVPLCNIFGKGDIG